jgi:hypothetical protein
MLFVVAFTRFVACLFNIVVVEAEFGSLSPTDTDAAESGTRFALRSSPNQSIRTLPISTMSLSILSHVHLNIHITFNEDDKFFKEMLSFSAQG